MGSRGAWAHAALFGVCAAVLLMGSFHGNVWFDEAYSVSLVDKPVPELLHIAAADVHPPLHYLALHVLGLLTGGSLLAYRLLSVAGALATATLGMTHVAPYLGRRAGMWFTALAALLPAQAYLANQARMYSWATFFVALCLLGALRVRASAKKDVAAGAAAWASLALGGLAAAYLHYFAALAAFATNVCLLASLVRLSHRGCPRAPRAVAVQLALAAAQLAAFAPLAAVALSQARSVAAGYWIVLGEKDLLRIVAAPLVSEPLEARLGWSHNLILLRLLAAGALVLLVCALHAAGRATGERRRAVNWGLAVYLAPAVLGLAVSVVLGTPVLYWRYLLVGAGPLCLALSVGLAGATPAAARPTALPLRLARSFGVILLALLVASSHLSTLDAAYDPASHVPAELVRSAVVPVVSADVTLLGALAASCPDAGLVCARWAGGTWGSAYDAFAPTLRAANAPERTLPSEADCCLWLADDDGAQAAHAAETLGMRVCRTERIQRPYDRRTYTFTLLTDVVSR